MLRYTLLMRRLTRAWEKCISILHLSESINMNRIFDELISEKIDLFRNAFTKVSRNIFLDEHGKIKHASEFGSYRESMARDLIKTFIPDRLDVGSGFLISACGKVSTQSDIVLFDPSATPKLENDQHQRFFPVECVCAVGEIKSVLNENQLKEAINKLARVKSICDKKSSSSIVFREPALKPPPNRDGIMYDQIVSFLICERFSFNIAEKIKYISSWYESDIQQRHRHNLILSVEDGVLCYVANTGSVWPYPPVENFEYKNCLFSSEEKSSYHIKLFCEQMFKATSSTTIFFPEIFQYMDMPKQVMTYKE